MEALQGKVLFSKMDIRWGYNNIRIRPEDRYKAAIKTSFRTYHPTVMYFGLCNAPAFFQCTMQCDFTQILEKYHGNIDHYMDDWWVATTDDPKGRELHLEILHAFLRQCEAKSYFLKPTKCQFMQSSMTLLGWLVTKEGLCIDPAKVTGISEWPTMLQMVKQVRQTLGVLGYQCPFIRNFTALAKPLTNLMKKDVPFEWTKECEDALKALILKVTSAPTLTYPDPQKQFELEVDAS